MHAAALLCAEPVCPSGQDRRIPATGVHSVLHQQAVPEACAAAGQTCVGDHRSRKGEECAGVHHAAPQHMLPHVCTAAVQTDQAHVSDEGGCHTTALDTVRHHAVLQACAAAAAAAAVRTCHQQHVQTDRHGVPQKSACR